MLPWGRASRGNEKLGEQQRAKQLRANMEQLTFKQDSVQLLVAWAVTTPEPVAFFVVQEEDGHSYH